jgi:tetratricopeptide (TPR) repeat protein
VPTERKLLGDWARVRAAGWAPYAGAAGGILSSWSRTFIPYGGGGGSFEPPQRQNPNRATDWVSFLGGRAAIQETLQTQTLQGGAAKEGFSIDVGNIPGVEVKAHPFDQMLGGQAGGRLALAEADPPDRFFAWFARPNALFPFLDQGADFLFRAGSLFSGDSIDDDLAGRYLARLGLSDNLSRKLLDSGQVLEMALAMPDLFLLDGTDLTVGRAELHLTLALTLHELADGSPGLLVRAVPQYHSALQLVTSEEAPEVWAAAHANLAAAYLTMPMMEASDQLRRGVAVQSLRNALKVYAPQSHPEQWASVQLNLANALVYAPSTHQGDNLVEAVELYEAVLRVRDRRSDPLGRARVLSNQGNVLAHLGMFDQAKAKLHEARFLFEEFEDGESVRAVRGLLDEIARQAALTRTGTLTGTEE